MTKSALQQTPDGYYLNRTPWFAFLLLCSIFAMWAAAAGMNDVLIAHFKKAFLLSDFETAFVQSAFIWATSFWQFRQRWWSNGLATRPLF